MFTKGQLKKPNIIQHGIKGGVACPECKSNSLSHELMIDRDWLNRDWHNGKGIEVAMWQFTCLECYCLFEIKQTAKDALRGKANNES